MPFSIEILIDETDPFPGGYHYLIWALKEVWDRGEYDVRVARGLAALKGADLVIPHFDITVTPEPVRRVLDRLPNVVNPGLYDISKRRFSENLLGPDADFDGPVIVKTDRNSGGVPERERQYRVRTVPQRVVRKLNRILRGSGRKESKSIVIQGCEYPIFETLSAVPRQVFDDPDLVVERFLPEEEGGLFYIRWYMFVGDRYRCARIGSEDPVVKATGQISREEGLHVPEEVVSLRHELQMDYGKIDFTIHDTKPVILDINRTPGGPPRERASERCSRLAEGIVSLLSRERGRYRAFTHHNVDEGEGSLG